MHPRPRHTSLSVHLPDSIVEVLKLQLLDSAFGEMRIWRSLIEADKLRQLYDSAKCTRVWDLMLEEAGVFINLGDEVPHLLDDVAGWLGVSEVVNSHAEDQVTRFLVMLI